MIAYDTQYPADRATATVTFNVNRNPNSPVFTQSSSYRVNVPESLPLGSNVTQVLASDADNVSLCNVKCLYFCIILSIYNLWLIN